MTSYQQSAYSWLLALLIPAFAVQVALANPIEEHAYDAAAFHVYRGVVFSDALRDGGLYPRWVMPINAGLGGPLFSFYSPLAYYVMDALHRLGLPHPVAWRWLVALALIAGSAGMFQLGLLLFKRADLALVGAACFIYAPYLLRDFFERGAPQGAAVALYPWLLWALLWLAERPSGPRFAVTALLWMALLLMHNLSAALLAPVLAIFLLLIVIRHGIGALRAPLLALVIGTLLSAFHVLPFLVDSKYVQLDSASRDFATQPASNPVSLSDLLALPTVFDTGLDNNFTGYSVGPLHALIVAAALIGAFALWRRKQSAEAVFSGSLSLFGLVMLWMQLESASPVWSALPALNILQFRTRLLSTIGLIAAIGCGYLLAGFSRLSRRGRSIVPILAFLLITWFVGSQLPSLYPQLLHKYVSFPAAPTVADGQAWATQNHVPGFTLTTTKELMPIWRQTFFSEEEVAKIAASPVDNLPQGGHILESTRRVELVQFKLDTPVPLRAALHVMYFPGWQGYLDGQPQPIHPMDVSGYTLMDIPVAGIHTVTLRYEGTDAQHVGDLLTVLSALALLVVAIGWRAKSVQQPEIAYLKPRWWLPAALIVLTLVKGFWIDPNTTLLRTASSCHADENATFAEAIHLCGYTVSDTSIQPGNTLRVTLYWQIDQPVTDPVSSFVHVLGAAFNPATNGPVWSQQDKQAPGWLPIQEWVTGKMYQDIYELTLPANTPAGEYQLEVGWYSPDGKRLTPQLGSAATGEALSSLDSVTLRTITLR